MKRFVLSTERLTSRPKHKITILVDDDDAYLLRATKWAFHADRNGNYVVRRADDNNGYSVYNRSLGRAITQCPDDYVVMHKNGNSLDFRRSNLKAVSSAERSREVGALHWQMQRLYKMAGVA